MASFMDAEGSVVKEINIQRKSINGSQVSAVLAVRYRFVTKFYTSCNLLPSLLLVIPKAFLPFAECRSIKFNHCFRCCYNLDVFLSISKSYYEQFNLLTCYRVPAWSSTL